MPKKGNTDFADQVWAAAAVVGMSPPRIVDHIISELFPTTYRAAEDEGASKILRDGCIANAKRVLHVANDDRQRDFGEIAPEFARIVFGLGRTSYHVEQLGEEIPVARLIAEPQLLDDARKFMRRKGEECIAEARRLDELFDAVTARASRRRGALARQPRQIQTRRSG